MKSLLLTTLLFFSANITGVNSIVYISTSPDAYAYHKTENCTPLKRSKYPTKAVSLEKAQNMGRTPCQKCYK